MPEVKTAKSKLVDVTILKPGGEVSFVQYYDKTRGAIRVTVPNSVIEDGKVPMEELDMGIPSPNDIDWDSLVLKPITPVSVAKAMRDIGVFTKEDLAAKRQDAIVAINRVTGLLLKDIIEQIGGNQ